MNILNRVEDSADMPKPKLHFSLEKLSELLMVHLMTSVVLLKMSIMKKAN